jgi:hypothetical protein
MMLIGAITAANFAAQQLLGQEAAGVSPDYCPGARLLNRLRHMVLQPSQT